MANKTPTKIFIAAGEASGDTLGAALIEQLNHSPTKDYQICAMGGSKMRHAGATIIVDSTKMGIVGFWEIVKHIAVIIKAMRRIKRYIRENKPQCCVFIDYPGMNLRLAKYGRQHNCKVLYYVSPQVWAWRQGRLKGMRKNINHMAVLFPFEEKFYKQAGIPVTFVGHPLVKASEPYSDKDACYKKLKLDPSRPVLALLPGSRNQEINRLLPVILNSVKLLQQHQPDLQYVMVRADSIAQTDLGTDLPITITDDLKTTLSISQAAICTSGTVTLEVALFKVPLLIIYKISFLTYIIGRMVIKLKHIGLCNLVTDQVVSKEFIQSAATAHNISEEAIRLLNNKQYRQQTLTRLEQLRDTLSKSSNNKTVAQLVEKLVEKK